jgi:UDP-glucuronate 4-epimerase
MKILVTGAAGFIGFHFVNALVERGDEVIGLDSINDYYDVNLKYARLKKQGIEKDCLVYGKVIKSSIHYNYNFIQLNIEDKASLFLLFMNHKFKKVCNFAAQAGVRYSLINPQAYIDSNINGFINILEACKSNQIEHLVYASSSSVYGNNEKMPLSVSDPVDHPISLYAATKKSNELMAHTYSHLFNLPTTGLRFFTVYGPWGRPDMAMYIFAKAIKEEIPVNIYNNGEMFRDFTYIEDVIKVTLLVFDSPPKSNNPENGTKAPYKIYNIGSASPYNLIDYIAEIEHALNKKAIKNLLPLQPGDVYKTFADISDLVQNFGYQPSTPLKVGILKYITWFLSFYYNSPNK